MSKTHFFTLPEAFVFIGKFSDNQPHRHYALQISIALQQPFHLIVDKQSQAHHFCAIKPNVRHQFDCRGQEQMILLINPASVLGHYLQQHQLSENVSDFVNKWSEKLKKLGVAFLKEEITGEIFEKELSVACENFSRSCSKEEHQIDERIMKALELMAQDPARVYSLEEVASEVFLSEGRFIHLFKQQTGITFRRMQLWQKLNKAIFLYCQQPGMSLTELAHTCGFADSAHFSRTFKENFGLKPSLLNYELRMKNYE